MGRKRRRRQRGKGVKSYARKKMGFLRCGKFEKQIARKHLLPMLYKNKKLRSGKTIGGVKFKVKRYDKNMLNFMSRGINPTGQRFKKDIYTVQASKKIFGKTFKRDIL